MRPALLRFTIRRSMALVAIVATLMASGLTIKRLVDLRADYQRRAVRHERTEFNARAVLGHLGDLKAASARPEFNVEEPPMDPADREKLKELMKTDPELQRVAAGMVEQEKLEKEIQDSFEAVAKAARSEVDYHANLRRKYERAAARPWISVPPDPEAPEVDLWAMVEEAVEKMVSITNKIPDPPGLEIVQPGPPGGK